MATISGGDKLLAALSDMADKVSRPGTLRVGFLENATYPDGKPVAMIAAIQNWGAPRAGIPPRPFFSNMVRAKSPGWGKDVATALVRTSYDARLALRLVGFNIEGQLRQSVKDTNAPPLAPSTIARKGHAKPLVDSGHMLNSIDQEIV